MQQKESMMKYDYLIVGAGLFGSTFAHLATSAGKKCLVLDRRPHAGGNVYCEQTEGITVHKYGPHIFHTDNKEVYDLVTSLVDVSPFVNRPVARYNGKMYNLPFNMNTFCQMWNITTPDEAKNVIEAQSREVVEIRNLEDKAISLVGRDIFEKLIKGYTEKQWGRRCCDLPAEIITRLPVRFTFDNRYFQDRYQFIPVGGYNLLIERLLEGSQLILETDYFDVKDVYGRMADKVVFTGRIDQFYGYRYGELEYRSLRFDTDVIECDNYQGNAVVNETDGAVPYTRTIEHRHFEQPLTDVRKTVITREYPASVMETGEPYYPINDARNNDLYGKYRSLADNEERTLFGGRLADYKYYDMDDTIEKAIELWKSESSR